MKNKKSSKDSASVTINGRNFLKNQKYHVIYNDLIRKIDSDLILVGWNSRNELEFASTTGSIFIDEANVA